jgi:hypothetical protein
VRRALPVALALAALATACGLVWTGSASAGTAVDITPYSDDDRFPSPAQLSIYAPRGTSDASLRYDAARNAFLIESDGRISGCRRAGAHVRVCANPEPTPSTVEIDFSGGTGDDELRIEEGFLYGEAWFFGDDGDDRITGARGVDLVYGGPGRDTIRTGALNDHIRGEKGADRIEGETGSDRIQPGSSIPRHPDRADGGQGNDTVGIGVGRSAHGGGKFLLGGAGNDVIKAATGAIDRLIDCGPGDDLAIVDERDPEPRSCETVE